MVVEQFQGAEEKVRRIFTPQNALTAFEIQGPSNHVGPVTDHHHLQIRKTCIQMSHYSIGIDRLRTFPVTSLDSWITTGFDRVACINGLTQRPYMPTCLDIPTAL